MKVFVVGSINAYANSESRLSFWYDKNMDPSILRTKVQSMMFWVWLSWVAVLSVDTQTKVYISVRSTACVECAFNNNFNRGLSM